jgi:hypothetical protein
MAVGVLEDPRRTEETTNAGRAESRLFILSIGDGTIGGLATRRRGTPYQRISTGSCELRCL